MSDDVITFGSSDGFFTQSKQSPVSIRGRSYIAPGLHHGYSLPMGYTGEHMLHDSYEDSISNVNSVPRGEK